MRRDADGGIALGAAATGAHVALLLPDRTGLRVLPLAADGVLVDGRPPTLSTSALHGDALTIADATFTVEMETDDETPCDWTIELGGRGYRVRTTPFAVGGADEDDLVVPGMAPRALVLHLAGHDLVVETSLPATASGIAIDRIHTVRDRDRIVVGDVSLRVRRGQGSDATTLGAREATRAVLRLLPHGGLLELRVDAARGVWLADRRCDLVAALLRPRGGGAGNFVPDAELLGRIWPGEPVTRTELNTLVFRARRTLTLAGFDGPRLVERAPSGGATRFRLAAGAEVDVTS